MTAVSLLNVLRGVIKFLAMTRGVDGLLLLLLPHHHTGQSLVPVYSCLDSSTC
jgi:hypothetical protein